MRRRKRKNKKKGYFLRSVILTLLALVFAVSGILYIFINTILSDAKSKAEDYMKYINDNTFIHSTPTDIYDYKGELITSLNLSHYNYISIDDVSPYIINGYIAVEDRQFYQHNGINFKAITRAVVAMIKNDGVPTQGGSTITQQCLKLNVLNNVEDDKERKLIELFLAPKFEESYTKDKILEFYVNTNFYYNNCYGVEMASKYYFGKSCKDLSLDEAAGLVGLSNSPYKYDPVKHPEEYIEKRDFVLSIMLQEGFITDEEYDKAKATELKLVLYREPAIKENYMVSYALDCATEELMRQNGFKFQYTFSNESEYLSYWERYNSLYAEYARQLRLGGYKIYTSLNQDVQMQLQSFLDKELSTFTDTQEDGRYNMQGSAVVINNKNNMVIAIVGGRGVDDEYNRAYQSHRQPGSSIKPIVSYAPAFDTGNYYPSYKITKEKGSEWYPNNWDGDYSGTISLRDAVARSMNTVAFRLTQNIGVDTSLDKLGQMKFNGISWQDNNNGSVAVGGFTNGVSSLEMAKAYNTLVNYGQYTDSSCLTKIVSSDRTIFEYMPSTVQVYTPESAAMTIDCMKDVIYKSYGTGGMAAVDNQIIAGKTGTTNDNKDGWFCGASSYYTCCVWCGFEYPKTVADMGGGTYPCRIFKDVMTYLHTSLPKEDFTYKDTMYRNIDYSGKPVNYNTNSRDLFSRTKYEESIRKAKEEEEARKKKKLEDDIASINNYITQIQQFQVNTFSDVKKLKSLYNDASYLCNINGLTYLSESVDAAYSKHQTKINQLEEQAQQEEKRKAEERQKRNDVLVKEAKSKIQNYKQGYASQSEVVSAIEACKGLSQYNSLWSEYEALLPKEPEPEPESEEQKQSQEDEQVPQQEQQTPTESEEQVQEEQQDDEMPEWLQIE